MNEPIPQGSHAIEAFLDLGEEEQYSVVSLELDEGISRITRAVVEIAAPDDIEFDHALTQRATLVFTQGGSEARRFTLVVGTVRFRGIEGGFLRYVVELFALPWLLGLVHGTRKFRKRTTREIVETVLGEQTILSSWQLTAPSAPRKYTAQYRETSLHFVERLLEFDGVYYSFAPDGTMLLADQSSASPQLPGKSEFDLVEAAGALSHGDEGIHVIRRGARLRSGAVTLNDCNWKNPELDLHQTWAADRDADLEVYDFPSGYRDPARGSELCRMRLEAARCEASYVEGKSNAVSFSVAHLFQIGSAAGELYAGEYLLTRLIHRYTSPTFAKVDEGGTYSNEFVAIPSKVPFRPPLLHQRPTVAGNHTAMVRGPAGEEIHTDKHGRFKAQFHWDREAKGSDEDSRWIRILQECGTSMALARVGWEMSIGYIDGDPDRPVGLARQINGQAIPAYAQPTNKTMMAMKTPSSPASGGFNELKMDDVAGAQRMDLRAEKDLFGVVKNDRTEQIGNNEMHLVGANMTHVVGANHTVTIGADQKVTVNGDDTLAVDGNRTKKVGAAELVEVGGTESLSVTGNDSEKVGASRISIVGGVGPPDVKGLAAQMVPSPRGAGSKLAMGAVSGMMSGGGAGGGAQAALGSLMPSMPSAESVVASMLKGSISRSTQQSTSRTIGAAYLQAAVGPISTSTKLGFAETVGGAKLTLAKKGISEDVGAVLATTVGAAILRTAKGDMKYSSKLARVTVGGMCSLDSLKSASIGAKSVTIEALATMKLVAGKLTIELSPTGIKVSGDLGLDAGGNVKVTAAKDDLTKA
jgi:type VI secretion system secreted protein VgrG